jgi:hypothetical protein
LIWCSFAGFFFSSFLFLGDITAGRSPLPDKQPGQGRSKNQVKINGGKDEGGGGRGGQRMTRIFIYLTEKQYIQPTHYYSSLRLPFPQPRGYMYMYRE